MYIYPEKKILSLEILFLLYFILLYFILFYFISFFCDFQRLPIPLNSFTRKACFFKKSMHKACSILSMPCSSFQKKKCFYSFFFKKKQLQKLFFLKLKIKSCECETGHNISIIFCTVAYYLSCGNSFSKTILKSIFFISIILFPQIL